MRRFGQPQNASRYGLPFDIRDLVSRARQRQHAHNTTLEYAPEPPFQAASRKVPLRDILEVVRCRTEVLRAKRERIAGRWIKSKFSSAVNQGQDEG